MSAVRGVFLAFGAVLGTALVTGCVHQPQKLITDVKPVEIRVPTPVPCVVDIPERPPTALPEPGSDIARKAAGASAEVRALELYAQQLRAALLACGGNER